ncbi:MAG TPA: tRNA (adenosine(37)-N6)-dimethylallyltransferase MiaA [Longilinea sp.]|nr:tRNA (adenosine(37)-N6)-dimethylallyltransferase MiaA [Longilinea sp.]
MRLCDIPDPLVVILGPTAVGKTDISIQLAEKLNGEIISADSRLFYRGMDIGTAKPSAVERQRVPHHLIDVCNPDETWSLAVFQKAAQVAIQEVHGRGKLPFLVGGTGQYIRAVIEGWDIPNQQPDFKLREALENWAIEIGPLELHRRLAVIDPKAANRILPGNVRRTIRALEVIFGTGKRFDEQRLKTGPAYSLLLIGLTRPRAELYTRVDARIEEMVKDGFLEEVKGLLEKGYKAELPSMSAIGYREMVAVALEKLSREATLTQMKSLTHQFVRRQANWFKQSDTAIHWFDAGMDCLLQIESLILTCDGWILSEQANKK